MKRGQIRLFGPPQIDLEGESVLNEVPAKGLALLGYLFVEGGVHSRQMLASLLWSDSDEARARANLRTLLYELQKSLPSLLDVGRQNVALAEAWQDAYWCDLPTFNEAIHEDTIESLVKAARLYRGVFLPGLYLDDAPGFDDWLLLQQERFRLDVLETLETLASHFQSQGNWTAAVDYLRRLLLLEPLRETSHRALMRLLARMGRFVEALAQFESCVRLLEAELGVSPAAETTTLYERIKAAQRRPRPSLPPQPTPFVARQEELNLLNGLLHDPNVRLITLLGPGGIGKSRLALEAARLEGYAFLDGVFFIPLAGLNKSDSLVPPLAGSLGFKLPERGDRRSELLDFLKNKELLLLLDNFDHLLDQVGLVSDILEKAPGVKLLVTSRESLRLRWETRLALDGLPYPLADEELAAGDYGALSLFQQAARRVRPSFSLADDTAAVARICRAVEGMPLGIELAAAFVDLYPPAEILAQIERNLDFLASDYLDSPERQRSLRAVFAYSWALLPANEQAALPRLSLFRGGFSREAAYQVAGATTGMLAALAEKSFIRPVEGRYEMHEIIRQYAAERLAEEGAEEATADRHADYFTKLVQIQERRLSSFQAAEAVSVFRCEMDNVRAAWRWAVAEARGGALARAFPALARFYEVMSLTDEGGESLSLAITAVRQRLDPTVAPWLVELLAARAHFHNLQAQYQEALETAQAAVFLAEAQGWEKRTAAATLCWAEALLYQGAYDAAAPYLEKSLALARSQTQVQTIAAALLAQATYLEHQGKVEEAQDNVTEALHIYQELRDPLGEAKVLRQLGVMIAYAGDYERSRDYYQRAQVRYRQLGDRRGESGIYNNLGAGFLDQGRYAEAREHLEQALQLRRELEAVKDAAITLMNLGGTAGMQGDFSAAQAYFLEALEIMRDIGNRRGEGTVLCFLGYAILCQHQYTAAEAVLQEGLAVTEAINSPGFAALARFRLGQIGWVRGETAGALAAFEAALEAAQQQSFPDLVLDVLADLGCLYQELGRKEDASVTSTKAASEARHFDRPPALAQALTRRGEVLLRQGQWEAAVAAYEEALDLRRLLHQEHLAVEALSGLAEAALTQGNGPRALAYVEEVLTVEQVTQLQGVLRPQVVYRVCYKVLQAVGDPRANQPGLRI